MACSCVEDIPGANDLVSWFGAFPSFHDAKAELEIRGDGTGSLKIAAFRMTSEIDEKGYFVLDRHCRVTLFFESIEAVNLEGFLPGSAILFNLDIGRSADGFEVTIEPSYGFGGTLRARGIRAVLEQGSPA